MEKIAEEESLEKNIQIVMRQTDYDMSKAKMKLEEYDNDVQSVLMEYMGVNMQEKKKKKEESMTMNQKIFKSIRDFF
jgi:N-acetylmuramic acid 6-phosphate (MurNAc-6-P) etherase